MESEKDKQENPQADVGQAPNAAPQSGEPAATPPAAEGAAPDSVSRRRVFIALGVAAIVIIGIALAMQRTPQEPNTPGSKVSAEITLITSDRTDVDCAAAAGIDKYHCGYTDESMAWNGDEKDKLRPYYTTDRHLFLIPGLFLQPALEARFKSEPPDKPRDLLKRFTAKCELKILGKVGGVKVRWLNNSPWGNPEEVEAASVVDCKVEG